MRKERKSVGAVFTRVCLPSEASKKRVLDGRGVQAGMDKSIEEQHRQVALLAASEHAADQALARTVSGLLLRPLRLLEGSSPGPVVPSSASHFHSLLLGAPTHTQLR